MVCLSCQHAVAGSTPVRYESLTFSGSPEYYLRSLFLLTPFFGATFTIPLRWTYRHTEGGKKKNSRTYIFPKIFPKTSTKNSPHLLHFIILIIVSCIHRPADSHWKGPGESRIMVAWTSRCFWGGPGIWGPGWKLGEES